MWRETSLLAAAAAAAAASDASISLFQFRYDIDTIFTKYRDIDIKYVSKMHTFTDINFNSLKFFKSVLLICILTDR